MMREKLRNPSKPLPPLPAGLCAECRHRRLHRGGVSVFVRCGLARIDPDYPRYPRLPVLDCRGYEPSEDVETPR